jgi:integrase
MGAGDHGLVFPGPDGRAQNPVNVSNAFRQLVAKTDLPPVTLHSLRHQHGTLCLERGMPVHAVASRLGHSPSVLLNIYAHARAGSQDSAAALEGLLDGGQPPALTVVAGPDEDEDDEPETLTEAGE